MSPMAHKIQSFRKLREKYSDLRQRTISEMNSTGINRTREWIVGYAELKIVAKGVADGTIRQSIEGSDWSEGDSDWETLTTIEPNSTVLDVYEDQHNDFQQKEKAESANAVMEVVNSYASLSEKNVMKMEWESALKESFDGGTRDSEDIVDSALGEKIELSDLLRLEKEQPDDISNLESPTRPKSPKQDNASLSSSDKMSIDFNYFDWSDEDDEIVYEFPATGFSHTEAAISDAEWALESLLPFKKYRAKTPTLLRACCTINNEA